MTNEQVLKTIWIRGSMSMESVIQHMSKNYIAPLIQYMLNSSTELVIQQLFKVLLSL
jgi:hypothetical protein